MGSPADGTRFTRPLRHLGESPLDVERNLVRCCRVNQHSDHGRLLSGRIHPETDLTVPRSDLQRERPMEVPIIRRRERADDLVAHLEILFFLCADSSSVPRDRLLQFASTLGAFGFGHRRTRGISPIPRVRPH